MDSRWGKASPRHKWSSVSANVAEGPLPAEPALCSQSSVYTLVWFSFVRKCFISSLWRKLSHELEIWVDRFCSLVFSVLPIPKVTVLCSGFCHCWEIPSTIALFKLCFVWFPLRFSISRFYSLTWRIHKVWISFNLSWMRIQVILILWVNVFNQSWGKIFSAIDFLIIIRYFWPSLSSSSPSHIPPLVIASFFKLKLQFLAIPFFL